MKSSKDNDKENILNLLSRSLVILASTCIVLAGLIIAIYFTGKSIPEAGVAMGTAIEVEEILSEELLEGRSLFKANCASCHMVNRELVGPALAHVDERRERDWLYKFIRNNVALRESGDEQANAIYNAYDQKAMNIFLQLTQDDIDNILDYIGHQEE